MYNMQHKTKILLLLATLVFASVFAATPSPGHNLNELSPTNCPAGQFLINIGAGIGTAGYACQTPAASYWQANGPSIYYNTGYIGIGINAPQSKLDIQNGGILVRGYNLPVGGVPMLAMGYNTALDRAQIMSVNSNVIGKQLDISGYPLIFRSSHTGNEQVRINTDGKVGIGVDAPTEKLDVAGKIKGTELCIGNVCKDAWPSESSGTITQVTVGSGMTGGGSSGSVSVRLSDCPAGQVLKSCGNNCWQCQADNVGNVTIDSSWLVNNAPQGTLCGSYKIQAYYYWTNLPECGYKSFNSVFDRQLLTSCAGHNIVSGNSVWFSEIQQCGLFGCTPYYCTMNFTADCPAGYAPKMIAYEHVDPPFVDPIFSAFYSCIKQ
ncbi:MAG: hypothetical protein J4215_01210 [Candidatus Diapherotrites archaeon]|uniref:Uncharacterized protein n=1 Tax=Candidatus Iainarchaeum sp. TaxID=3101447 RepID=A0A8T4L1P2_9ARCH|nr:hypothetical protein [Candidatus Diapherotrites archaeon]